MLAPTFCLRVDVGIDPYGPRCNLPRRGDVKKLPKPKKVIWDTQVAFFVLK